MAREPETTPATVLVIDDSPTILKVVQLVLAKAGYTVRTATDGENGIASAREVRPDVILLDFVMPRLNGYQVCRVLAETEGLRDVPVVLMSAKGDQVGERFVRVMGIVDYITKPFSPEAISAVVAHTLAKFGRRAITDEIAVAVEQVDAGDEPAPLPPVETALPAGPAAAAAPVEPVDKDEATGRHVGVPTHGRRAEQVRRLREAVARAAAASDELLGDELREKVQAALTDEVVARILDDVGAVDASSGSALAGELAAVPLAEVLSLLATQRQSGVLSVESDGARVDVHFRDGLVEHAAASGLGDEFLFGHFLVQLGLVDEARLGEALAAARAERGLARPDDVLLGENLVRRGWLADDDRAEALRRQTCERIYEVLRWRGGRFRFKPGRDLGAVAEAASLRLAVDGILMEGFRRVDEWHLIERQIDDFDAVFLRNEAAIAALQNNIDRARLSRDELSVLELVDGKRNVRDVVRASRLGSFEVTKMLFRLLSIKVIRRRVPPVVA